MVKELFVDTPMGSDQTAVLNASEDFVNVISLEILWVDTSTENNDPIDGVLNIYSSHGLGKCLEKSVNISTSTNINDTTIVDITGPARMIILEYSHNAITGGQLSVKAVLRRV